MVYGDMLGFFPELQRPFDYFEMSPKQVAGYNERVNVRTVYGIYQEVKAGTLQADDDTWNATDVPLFFTREDLTPGKFIAFPGSQMVYRITKNNDWTHEGGFNCYTLETLSGNTDVQKQDTGIVKPASRFQ